MRFPKRTSRLVQFQQFPVLGGDFLLPGGLGKFAGCLRDGNGV
jgi:hypothetical protein